MLLHAPPCSCSGAALSLTCTLSALQQHQQHHQPHLLLLRWRQRSLLLLLLSGCPPGPPPTFKELPGPPASRAVKLSLLLSAPPGRVCWGHAGGAESSCTVLLRDSSFLFQNKSQRVRAALCWDLLKGEAQKQMEEGGGAAPQLNNNKQIYLLKEFICIFHLLVSIKAGFSAKFSYFIMTRK